MITLYRKNQLGIGTWSIWVGPIVGDEVKIHYAHSIVEGGAIVEHSDRIELNQSGRTITMQAELEINARVSRMLDKGYKRTREEAKAGATNQLGLRNPMLAQSLDKIPPISFSRAFVQPKLDGHRCLITKRDDAVIAYSRLGKSITSVNHILRNFEWLREGQTTDGELYVHGRLLQDIGSHIKREQAASESLEYHWYDLMTDEPFDERWRHMRDAYERHPMSSVFLTETVEVTSMEQVYDLFLRYKKLKFEGAMLRLLGYGYEESKRSRSLIKVKSRLDCEVTVEGGMESREGWAVLKVRTDWGTRFNISAPGSVKEKVEVWQNLPSYIGRRLTIEYAFLTADKIPFHAVAIRWRDDI